MLPKVDPRIKRTRQLIFSAFRELMLEGSFQAMTVQDISERAGINRATFYAHFLDKYQLHEEVIGEWFQQQLEQAIDVNEGMSRENLVRLIGLVFRFLGKMNGQCHPEDRQYKPLIERQIQSKIQESILGWLKDSSAKPEMEATAISWTIFGLGLRWGKGELGQNQELVVEDAIRLIEKSLGQSVF